MRGIFEPTPTGGLGFESAPWIDTLWENREGNNPQLFSVLSRTSLSAWHRFARHEPAKFSETMFRLPSFVAGLLTIPAAMWVLGLLGLPRAGAACAFLIAIHPWHIRYSAEGRGYALAMLFSVTLLGCALQTIRTGRWRWWAGLGRLLAGGRDRVFAATTLVLPVVLGFAHQRVSGHLLHLWYFIFALPSLAILITIGTETLSGFPPGTVRRAVVAGVLTAMVAVFGILTLPQTEVIRHYSKEQVREAVERATGFSDPSGNRQPEAMVINCLSHAPFYLPAMPRAHRPAQLIPLLDEAVRSGRPLYLIEGHEDPIRTRLPEIWTILQDRRLFEQIAVFPGLEERQFNHYVLRFHPERWSEIAETIRSAHSDR